MSKVLLASVAAVGLAVGWVGGSLRPIPAAAVAALDGKGLETRLKSGLAGLDLEARAEKLFTADQWSAISSQAVRDEAKAGRVIPVERVDAETLEGVRKAAEVPQVARSETGTRSGELCPGMTVSNAPPTAILAAARDLSGRVAVKGVALSVNPAPGACLSSGFGPRGGRTHKGLDYHSRTGGPVFSAGAGVVREMKYRDDYGNMVLIDHGNGVFTRYAHLAGFASGLSVGSRVAAGAELGLMGNTAAYPIPVHLHYEVLLGDYETPKQSFGLEAVDPYDLPRA